MKLDQPTLYVLASWGNFIRRHSGTDFFDHEATILADIEAELRRLQKPTP